jgi:hypothetical protein
MKWREKTAGGIWSAPSAAGRDLTGRPDAPRVGDLVCPGAHSNAAQSHRTRLAL